MSYSGSKRQMAAAQGGICPWCKLPLPADLAGTSLDHIIPRVSGGPDLPWNWQLLHAGCNGSKWATITDEARALAAEHGVTLAPLIQTPPRSGPASNSVPCRQCDANPGEHCVTATGNVITTYVHIERIHDLPRERPLGARSRHKPR